MKPRESLRRCQRAMRRREAEKPRRGRPRGNKKRPQEDFDAEVRRKIDFLLKMGADPDAVAHGARRVWGVELDATALRKRRQEFYR